MGERLRVLLTKEEIHSRVDEVASQIRKDYEGKSIHMICVLKGGVIFMCDLARRLENMDVSFDFMSVSSYGGETKSSGIIRIDKDLDEPLEGKNVLIVEDIVDSGQTLSYLSGLLLDRKPNSLEICALLNKPSRREKIVAVKYSCFDIPDKFVVGYGLDYDQRYRNLPYIAAVEFD